MGIRTPNYWSYILDVWQDQAFKPQSGHGIVTSLRCFVLTIEQCNYICSSCNWILPNATVWLGWTTWATRMSECSVQILLCQLLNHWGKVNYCRRSKSLVDRITYIYATKFSSAENICNIKQWIIILKLGPFLVLGPGLCLWQKLLTCALGDQQPSKMSYCWSFFHFGINLVVELYWLVFNKIVRMGIRTIQLLWFTSNLGIEAYSVVENTIWRVFGWVRWVERTWTNLSLVLTISIHLDNFGLRHPSVFITTWFNCYLKKIFH